MTEEDVKTKWCPYTRITEGASGDIIANRDIIKHGDYCIGPECMAWRENKSGIEPLYMGLTAKQWIYIEEWCTGKVVHAQGDNIFDKRGAMLGLFSASGETIPDSIESEHGYCGLAGKP
jgi:hypothetical protein